MERILAIQIKRIGDLVLTAPALMRLRRARPRAHLALVTMGAAGQLVPCIPGIDEHLNYRPRSLNASLWTRLLLGRFDTVLDFNGTDRAAGMTFLTQASVRAGYEKRARGFPRELMYNRTSPASLTELHTVDHMMALLELAGVDGGPLDAAEAAQDARDFQVPATELAAVRVLLAEAGLGDAEPFAVMHPGTARSEKYWPAERWAEVARRLSVDRGMPIVITGGRDPIERAHIAAIRSAARGARLVDLSGKLSLMRSAAVISAASLALGVDTAAMHLAGDFGTPQVVLFGPTNPYHWRPRHAAARVVLAGEDSVLTDPGQFQQRIDKRAMTRIRVEQVLAAVESLPAGAV